MVWWLIYGQRKFVWKGEILSLPYRDAAILQIVTRLQRRTHTHSTHATWAQTGAGDPALGTPHLTLTSLTGDIRARAVHEGCSGTGCFTGSDYHEAGQRRAAAYAGSCGVSARTVHWGKMRDGGA